MPQIAWVHEPLAARLAGDHLGLKRRAVFTLRHGETVPESVVRHLLCGEAGF